VISRALRVLFVNPGRDLGGAERSLLLLIQSLRKRGVDPTVALFGDGPFAARLASLDIRTVFLEVADVVRRASRYRVQGLVGTALLSLRALPSVVRLARLARRLGVDVVHTNGLKAHVLGGLAGRLVRRPVVWHVRDFLPDGLSGHLFRRSARLFPAMVFTVSDAVAADLGALGQLTAPVVKLYDPIDIAHFEPCLSTNQIREELSLSAEALLVGMVAHLTPWKGHEDFLRIARIVGDAMPQAHFLVAGGPIYDTEGHSGYAESLRGRAAMLGLRDRVTFLGNRDDVPKILASLDVLVHCPTAPEPYGLVVIEAMAAQRPVVAARAGGIPEIVQHEITGLLIAPGDVAGFAAAVLRLLGDPALRGRMGEAGRRRAGALFDPSQHAATVLDAYRALT
jgi:glycosyltransferase involved in cell wall biosynthesis